MNAIRRGLPIVAVFGVALVSGIVPGIWSDRWANADALTTAAAKLENVPLTLGDWDGQDLELNPRVLTITQASGILSRRYVHRQNGSVVSLVLVAGRPGPVAVHTPDVCYRGSGFAEIGTASKLTASADPAQQFWIRRFNKEDAAVPLHVRVFYAWSAGGPWEAADNPRVKFARSGLLYKLYVIREMQKDDEPVSEDPSWEFLKQLLPELRRSLFPAA
jgi:hypothetical protein